MKHLSFQSAPRLIDLMMNGDDTSTADETNDIDNWVSTNLSGNVLSLLKLTMEEKIPSHCLRGEIFCAKVEKDPNLHQDFNLLRYSQRSVIVRDADVH